MQETNTFIANQNRLSDLKSIYNEVQTHTILDIYDLSKEMEVVLFGIGVNAQRFNQVYGKKLNVKQICDNNADNFWKKYDGLSIISPNELAKNIANYVVIITCFSYLDVGMQLKKLGCKHIYCMHLLKDRREAGSSDGDKIIIDIEKLNQVRSMLNDEISLKTVDEIVKCRREMRIFWRDYVPVFKNQYFLKDLLDFSEEEVYVDCGAYNGDSLDEFIKTVNGKYKRIYALEPCKSTMESIKQNYPDERIIKLQYAVWNCKEKKHLSYGGDLQQARISDGEGKEEIDCDQLDHLIKEKVTFIKMDIEGAEMSALIGAKEIIKRDKPKLAICIYHKYFDLWEIPLYIKELVPEYRFYIRHHSEDSSETVLYAIL